jgi:hypothetical protein
MRSRFLCVGYAYKFSLSLDRRIKQHRARIIMATKQSLFVLL